ncbi:MAG TPA: DNA-binding transcriptional regulator [Rariglobus sp.]|nr:DNA-binding transcriptional regulator [Rariglobus sp.]
MAVLIDTSSGWGRDIIRGIHEFSKKQGGWQLFVEPRGIEESIELPRNWRGDGVIARVNRPELARQLKSRRIPVVNVSAIQLPGANFPRVASDTAEVARFAARYFLGRGFRNFAYVGLQGHAYASHHRDAFLEAVRSNGRTFDEFDFVTSGFSQTPDWNFRIEKLASWLKGLPKPVAVLTWSGGREIIYACIQAKLAVPEQVALLSGANDELLCEVSPIPISAVQQSCQEIGGQAAALLRHLMQGEKPPAGPRWISPLSVITRQSTDSLAITDSHLIAALNYARNNSDQLIQVGDLCEVSGLSRRLFERRFVECLGQTPANYIRRLHIERAKKLLAETDLPVPEVASRSGFGSPEYFAFVLVRDVGLSPLRFRKAIRGW